MSYFFVEKTQIPNNISDVRLGQKILVVEPEADFLGLICHVLARENFHVKPVAVVTDISTAAKEHLPEIAIISTTFLKHPEFKIFRQNPEFARIKLVSIGNLSEHEDLKGVMNSGFSGHLDRKLSRPQDLVKLINCLLTLN